MRTKMKAVTGCIFLLAGLFLIYPFSANADLYNGAWQPESGNEMITMDITMSQGAGSLYMYDWNNTASNLFLINDEGISNSGTLPSQQVYFFNEGGNWYASLNDSGNPNSKNTLELTSGTLFGFYFYNNDTNTIQWSYDLSQVGPSWTLLDTQGGSGMAVAVSGASPVSIPQAFWLLGSGLIALIGISSRGKLHRRDRNGV